MLQFPISSLLILSRAPGAFQWRMMERLAPRHERAMLKSLSSIQIGLIFLELERIPERETGQVTLLPLGRILARKDTKLKMQIPSHRVIFSGDSWGLRSSGGLCRSHIGV